TLLVNVPYGSISQREGSAITAAIVEVRAQGDSTLDGTGNDFGDLNILAGNNVRIVDTGSLTVRADATGVTDFAVRNLDIADGSLGVGASGTSLIANTLPAGSLLRVAGNATLSATTGSLTLSGNEHFDIGGDATLKASGLIAVSNVDQIGGVLNL